MLKSFQEYLSDLFFPVSCLSCHQPGTIICSDCLKTIKPIDLQVCPLCEKAVTLNGEVCRPCQQRFKPALNRLVVVADYQNKLLAQAIHLFKYKFIKDLAQPLATLMISNSKKLTIPVPDYILPIPLHPRRLRWRGFNQSELLARELSKKLLPGLNIPLLDNLIIRAQHTKPQMKIKNYQKRHQNIKDIFILNNKFIWDKYNLPNKNLQGKNILIVDDVSTTGATIFNYARELKKLNPKSISAIILGRQH